VQKAEINTFVTDLIVWCS